MQLTGLEKIVCPFCGYEMPILRDRAALCAGVYVQCKARTCRRWFEIQIIGVK